MEEIAKTRVTLTYRGSKIKNPKDANRSGKMIQVNTNIRVGNKCLASILMTRNIRNLLENIESQ